MYTVYGMADSGNCYKVKLLLNILDLPYKWIEIDIIKGESRTPDFLMRNPNGKVPVLETPDGAVVSESNAILYYLAQETSYFPKDRLTRSHVMQWMFFEQYSHEPYIATSRYLMHMLDKAVEFKGTLDSKKGPGYAALDVMEEHLSENTFFVGETLSIADIALYAYTHVAPQGGFDLQGYDSIESWLNRVAQTEKYVPLHPDYTQPSQGGSEPGEDVPPKEAFK